MAIIKTINDDNGNQILPVTVLDAVIDNKTGDNLRTLLRQKNNEDLEAMAEVTYEELYEYVQLGKLIPGKQYRIIDYFTIVNTDTPIYYGKISHNLKPFDIIVTADTKTELNKYARACHSLRDKDGYYSNSDLGSWILKYDINNDSTKYNWADPVNGKGVIYYMQDEFDNICYYDFKSIVFNLLYNSGGTDVNLTTYTFGGFSSDQSLTGKCYNNTIKPFRASDTMTISTVVFTGLRGCKNILVEGCINIIADPGVFSQLDIEGLTVKYGIYEVKIQCSYIKNVTIGESCNGFSIVNDTINLNIADNLGGPIVIQDVLDNLGSLGEGMKYIDVNSAGEVKCWKPVDLVS
jgi:hypothetical protein